MSNNSPRPHQCADRYARCERKVEQDGDYCPLHDIQEPDWDSIRKDRLLDERNT